MPIQYIAPGPRMSKAVVCNGFVFLSGQLDEAGPDVATQTKATLAKIDELLAQAGSDKTHLLSATIWLADISTFDEMNPVWEAWIDPQAPPARATVESKLARPNAKVEIGVIAAVKEL